MSTDPPTFLPSGPQGWLIVEKSPHSEYHNMVNRIYRGIDRIPRYYTAEQNPPPAFLADLEAHNEYLFGDYTDADTGLIGSQDRAIELLNRFTVSRHNLEIIFCRSGFPQSMLPVHQLQFLGWDVADPGPPFYSDIGHIFIDPTLPLDLEDQHNRLSARAYDQFNACGLLDTRENADAFLMALKSGFISSPVGLPSGAVVWEIYLLITSM